MQSVQRKGEPAMLIVALTIVVTGSAFRAIRLMTIIMDNGDDKYNLTKVEPLGYY